MQIRQLAPVVNSFQQGSIKLAQENVSLLRKSYADGLTSITAVLQAQQQFLALQNLYYESFEKLMQAKVEFEMQQASNPLLKKIYGVP